MQTVELSGKKRDIKTKGALRVLRVEGEVPAVVYGGKKSPVPLSVAGKELLQVIKAHGANVILSLKVGSDTETVLVKEVQRDPISHKPIHVDFQRISLTDKIEVNVPLHVKGEAPGVKLAGGILEHILREVRVKALATAVPSALEVDVSGLQINQGLKVKDIAAPAGVEILASPDQIVVNVVAPMTFEEEKAPAAAAAGAGPAEPEVIAKGKKPEEGEAAAAPAAGAKPAAGGKEAKPAAAPAKEAKK